MSKSHTPRTVGEDTATRGATAEGDARTATEAAPARGKEEQSPMKSTRQAALMSLLVAEGRAMTPPGTIESSLPPADADADADDDDAMRTTTVEVLVHWQADTEACAKTNSSWQLKKAGNPA